MPSEFDDMPAYHALAQHAPQLREAHLRDLFAQDEGRAERLHVQLDGLYFDYSKHHITDETLTLLQKLSEESGFEEKRRALFAGEKINKSEDRAVLHTSLRRTCGIDEIDQHVQNMHAQIKEVSAAIRGNKAIRDVVCIGIGGSDFGPRLVCEALSHMADGPRMHFLSNIDGQSVEDLQNQLDPSQTALIIISKTFTTLETMQNARLLYEWLTSHLHHVWAVTAAKDKALDFGVAEANILPLWDWIGGRYSLWSSVGISIAISLGYENFQNLLAGAKAADEHFLSAPFKENIPLLMGLLGIWYRNFLGVSAHAILPYGQALENLPAYIQQLDMESNGKSVSVDGAALHHKTGPIVFGGAGTNAQHAFFQLLHQGTEIIPCDFIVPATPTHAISGHHDHLLSNALAQASALMMGQDNAKEPHRHFRGGTPSSFFVLDQLNPYCLGLLLALYEHKIFVQGAIWNINSFDQWGVELGKGVAKDIYSHLQDNKPPSSAFDGSTNSLLAHIKGKISAP